MDKVEILKAKADVLHDLLNVYAKDDEDAEMVLRCMDSLFREIQEGKIIPPFKNIYRWYFASTESPLYRKYEDLSHAASEYSSAIEDWSSQDWYKSLKKNDSH